MSPKNPAAVALGRRGGKARVRNQTAEQRSESARRAADARWEKQKTKLSEVVSEITEGTKRLEATVAARAKKKEKSNA
jgi:hypothetical protein